MFARATLVLVAGLVLRSLAAQAATPPPVAKGVAKGATTTAAPERERPVHAPGAAGVERVALMLEGPFPAALAALAESDLRTAFGRRGIEVSRRALATAGAQTGVREVVLTVTAANERLDQIALVIAGGAAPAISRHLDLASFPPDGRMLALVVAADELIAAASDVGRLIDSRRDAAGERRSPVATRPAKQTSGATDEAAAGPAPLSGTGATAPPPAARPADVAVAPATRLALSSGASLPPAAAATVSATPAPPAPSPPAANAAATVSAAPAPARSGGRRDSLAAAFSFDHFSGGQTHLGPDLAWRHQLGGVLFASLTGMERESRSVTTTAGTIDARLLGGRLAGGIQLLGGDGQRAVSLAADAGVRAGRLWFEGRPSSSDGTFVGHDVGGFVVYADAMLSLDVKLGRAPVALRLGVGAGAPLLAQAATNGTAAITAASGIAFESQTGLALSF